MKTDRGAARQARAESADPDIVGQLEEAAVPSRTSRPQFDIVALRAKLGPSYDDRLQAAARRAVRENPAASRADSFERAARIAGPLPRVRGRKLDRPEARARRKRYAAVLGSALDACRRRRRDAGAGRAGHRRAPAASGSRRRGTRRATGSGDRAGPDDPDSDDPPGEVEAPPAGRQIAELLGGAA